MRVIIPIIVGVLGIATGAASLRMSKASGHAQNVELTSASAIAKAKPLISALAPGEETLNLTATSVMLPGSERDVHRHWRIDASTLAGVDVAYVVLDADSGELALASRMIKPRLTQKDHGLNEADIAATALDWCRELCGESPGNRWEKHASVQHSGRNWLVTLHRTGRLASLIIASGTAELISLKTRTAP
jgi:hypothetical protein